MPNCFPDFLIYISNMPCLRLPSLDISPALFICSSTTRPHCALLLPSPRNRNVVPCVMHPSLILDLKRVKELVTGPALWGSLRAGFFLLPWTTSTLNGNRTLKFGSDMKSRRTSLLSTHSQFLVLSLDVFQLIGWLCNLFLAWLRIVVNLLCAPLRRGPYLPSKLGLLGVCLWVAMLNEPLKLRCGTAFSALGCCSLWLTNSSLIGKLVFLVPPWLGTFQYVGWISPRTFRFFLEFMLEDQDDLNLVLIYLSMLEIREFP